MTTNSEQPHLRIAFGSCYGLSFMDHRYSSDIFTQISNESPDVFLWLGDAAYIDKSPVFRSGSVEKEEIQKRYQNTKDSKGYAQMLKKTKVFGVWDDHDFGQNDSGKELEGKHLNRELYLDFVDEPLDSERRLQRDSPIHIDYFIDHPNGFSV